MPQPNFLIIGAARSGTTALARFLDQHPDVFMCDPKETHFLSFAGEQVDFQGPGDATMINQRAVTDAAAYSQLFSSAQQQQAMGEGSVSTLYYHEKSIKNIQQYAPQAKMVVVLRNPVERAYSSFLYMTARGNEPLDSFAASLDAEPERIRNRWHHIWHYTKMGFYYDQLQAFRQAFGDERMLMILSEDLKKNSQATLAQVFTFLGVDASFQADTQKAINSSGKPKNQLVSQIMNRLAKNDFVRAIAHRTMSLEARHALRQANLKRPEMPSDCRERLEALYRDEIDLLESLLKRNLTDWKQACARA